MKMWCLQILLFILFISLSCVTTAAEFIHVFGYEGKEAKVSCSYDEGYESYEKYLCRNDCSSDDVLITTVEGNKNRYSISDDKNKQVFTTTISNLYQHDAGKYWCGVTRTGTDYYPAEVKLDVVTDICCDSSTKLQSYEGGSVSISCSYESKDQNNMKYICRGNQPSTCLQQALITSDNKQNQQFSLTDDKVSTFTVNIASLTQKDSGSYLCGVQRNSGLDVFSAVDLEVKENICCDSSTKIQSYEGGSVSIICPYESKDQNNMKYICRGNQPSTCLQQALITSDNKQNQQFSLTDDKVSTFTVNITNLTQKDSGSYICGVQRNTGLDVFSAVELEVKEWCCVKSNKLSGTVGHPLTMQCPYPPRHGTNRKFLCKGDHHRNCTDMVTSQNSSGQADVRFTLQDDVSSSSFSVSITELTAGDAGTYWCGSDSQWSFGNYTKIQLSLVLSEVAVFNPVVFIVPAVLLFTLILALFVVCKYKCHKVKGTGANVNRTTTKAADAEEAETDIYENQDVVVNLKQRTSKQQSTCNQYDDTGGAQQDTLYGNFNCNETEDIYCNEVYSKR